VSGKIAPKSNVVEVADLVSQWGRQNRGMHYGKPTKMLPGFVPLACHQRTSCEQGRTNYDYFPELPLIWILAQCAGFYIGWKDTESFRHYVALLAHEGGVKDFSLPAASDDDEDEGMNIPELMQWAHQKQNRINKPSAINDTIHIATRVI
jgi:hypothetical protein